jgi:hypothetical protein
MTDIIGEIYPKGDKVNTFDQKDRQAYTKQDKTWSEFQD